MNLDAGPVTFAFNPDLLNCLDNSKLNEQLRTLMAAPRYMTDFRERKNQAWQGYQYSVRRMDLLVISVSGAGVYVCLELLKFLKSLGWPFHWSIYCAGVLFVLAIAVNFVSQIYGRKANWYDYLWCEDELSLKTCDQAKKEELQESADKNDDLSERYSLITGRVTDGSIWLMALGLVALLSYFVLIF